MKKAAALIVGINSYEEIDELTGCIDDAIDALQWLVSVGVDPSRIHLLASPLDALPSTLPDGLHTGTATHDEIRNSIGELLKLSGDRLFVFFSGHGLHTTSAKSIFLASDFDLEFATDRNVPITHLVDLCLESKFKDTLIVLDACQNYQKVDDIYRSPIQPGSLGRLAGHAKRENGVFVCMAASTGTRAPIIGGRGLLTEQLLTSITEISEGVPEEVSDVCSYNWDSGEASIDIIKLFELVVADRVIDAAQASDRTQEPAKQEYGRFSRRASFDLHTLQTPPKLMNQLKVVGTEGVRFVRIEQHIPHLVSRRVKSSDLSSGRFSFATPEQSDIDVSCSPRSDWNVIPETGYIAGKIQKTQTFDFKLTKDPACTSPEDPAVALVYSAGSQDKKYSRLKGRDYKKLFESMPGNKFPFTVRRFADRRDDPLSVSIGRPVTDPSQVVIDPDVFRKTLKDMVSSDPNWSFDESYEVTEESSSSQSFLQFELSEEDVRISFGYLAGRPVIDVQPLDDGGSLESIQFIPEALVRFPHVEIEPGRYRVTTKLPWSNWRQTISITEPGELSIRPLPDLVNQPVRHRILLDKPQPESVLVCPVGVSGIMSLGRYLESTEMESLTQIASLPDVIVLIGDAASRALQPYTELFSNVEHEIWDQMFYARNLREIDVNDAYDFMIDLDFGSGETSIYALGLAYSLWEQQGQAAASKIRDCIDILSPGISSLPDVALLRREIGEDFNMARFPKPVFTWGHRFLKPGEIERSREPDIGFQSVLATYAHGKNLGGYLGEPTGALHPWSADPYQVSKRLALIEIVNEIDTIRGLMTQMLGHPNPESASPEIISSRSMAWHFAGTAAKLGISSAMAVAIDQLLRKQKPEPRE